MHLDKNGMGKEQRGACKRNEEYLREVGKKDSIGTERMTMLKSIIEKFCLSLFLQLS